MIHQDRELEKFDLLPSAVGIDYNQLYNLLKNKQWEKADEETVNLIVQVMKNQRKELIYVDDIKKFPCADLFTIDRLWSKFSNHRFGLNIQAKIYKNLEQQIRPSIEKISFEKQEKYRKLIEQKRNEGRKGSVEIPKEMDWRQDVWQNKVGDAFFDRVNWIKKSNDRGSTVKFRSETIDFSERACQGHLPILRGLKIILPRGMGDVLVDFGNCDRTFRLSYLYFVRS
ncbi:MAG: GUN4 domain-containing protein, partial [Cyanobacteria bacterium P01_E01_bin.42]